MKETEPEKPAVVKSYKAEAIRYWEIRRIVWNLILVPPSLLAYWFASGIAVGTGDQAVFGWPMVASSFCFSAVGANICYCFAYVVEFWVQGAGSEDGYRSVGRHLLFALGCMIGVGLALLGGASIAQAQYPVQL